MKILLTGGAGFIGSHISKKLLENNHRVLVLDNLSSGNAGNIPKNAEFIKGDITDQELWKKLPETDFIIHLAALVSVAESMNNPRKCQDTNVNSLFSLLEYALRVKTRKIIFASSAAVYGDSRQPSQSETDLPAPKSFYGLSKLNGEHILNIFQKEHNIPFTGFRMFNVFGPGQSPDSDYASVIPCFIQCGKQNEPLQIHGDGEQKRDFVYVKQVAEYYAAALESEFTGICNIGSGQNTSVRELAETILEKLGTDTKSKTVFTMARPGDIRNSLANISLLQKHFKPVEVRDFKTAIQETIAAY